MGKVPNPPADSDADDRWEAKIERLRAECDGWAFAYQPELVDGRWEAKRKPLSIPAGGGIAWVVAPSAERLRELIDGGHEVEAKAAKASAEAPVYGGGCAR